MRELKFRAWDRSQKKFLFIKFGNALYSFATTDIICQYTGLKDKNKKEIYEGDIVEFDTNGIKWMAIREVIFIEGKFSPIPSDFTYDPKFKVVGNIYENPGLLKKEDGENG